MASRSSRSSRRGCRRRDGGGGEKKKRQRRKQTMTYARGASRVGIVRELDYLGR